MRKAMHLQNDKRIRRLLDFRFKKHPKYSLDRARLTLVEYAVQQRAAELPDE